MAAIVSCRSCKAKIFFAPTPAGKSVPLDALPAGNGNYEIDEDGIARALTKERRDELEKGTPLYISHFATCPDAKRYKKGA